jgi:O-antigen/teichoic acid export membrane protein
MDSPPPLTATSTRPASSRIVDNILALGVGQVFTWVATAGLVVILPRSLGDEKLGVFTAAVSLTDFAGLLATFGITSYVTKELARDDAMRHGGLLNALAMRLPLALLAGLLAVLASMLMGYSTEAKVTVLLLCLNVGLSAANGALLGALQGMQDMRPVAVTNAVSKLVLLGAVALMMALGTGVAGVAAAWIVSNAVVTAGYGVALLRRRAFGGRLAPATWAGIAAGSLPFFVWQASLMFYGQIDVVLLSVLTRDEVVGWYGAAYRIITIPVFLPVMITSALFPALAAAAVESNERFIALARRGLQIVLMASIPIAAGLALVAGRLMGFLGYPGDFDRAVPIIIILSLHVPLVAGDMIVGSALAARDRQRVWALTGVAAAVINPALNLLLIPYFDSAQGNGAIGAAIATLATEMFMMAAGLWLLPERLLDRVTLTIIAKCLLASAIMAAVVVLLRDVPLPITVAAAALAYGAAALGLGLISSTDVRHVRTYVSRRAARGGAQPSTSAAT